jgi:hypothetical protein
MSATNCGADLESRYGLSRNRSRYVLKERILRAEGEDPACRVELLPDGSRDRVERFSGVHVGRFYLGAGLSQGAEP